jgi:hypothetical protein
MGAEERSRGLDEAPFRYGAVVHDAATGEGRKVPVQARRPADRESNELRGAGERCTLGFGGKVTVRTNCGGERLPVFAYDDILYVLFLMKVEKRLDEFKKRKREPEYIRWTKNRMCAVWHAEPQGYPTEFHHYGPRGLGQKAPDQFGMPLCMECHRHYDDTGMLPGMTPDQTKKYMKHCVAENFLMWIWEKGEM